MKPLVIIGHLWHFRKRTPLEKACRKHGIKTIQVASVSRLPKPLPDDALYIAWRPVTNVRTACPEKINGQDVLNAVFNCDKRNVQRHHQKVFGYSTEIDPTTYCGRAVIKGRGNATHDGRIVTFPIKKRLVNPRKVYERLIDGTSAEHEDTVCDIRFGVFLGAPVIAYLKFRPVAERFQNKNSKVVLLKSPGQCMSQDEIQKCVNLAKSMKLGYGEMDIIRDRQDRRIYVVDVNNTPYGPPPDLPEHEKQKAIDIVAESLKRCLSLPRPRLRQ